MCTPDTNDVTSQKQTRENRKQTDKKTQKDFSRSPEL